MRIRLDRDSTASPLYAQIEAFFRNEIGLGNLPPGTRLPSTRGLASDIGVSRITVQTAYANLEADGLLSMRIGSGAYVIPTPPVAPRLTTGPEGPWPLWQQHFLEDPLGSQQLTARPRDPPESTSHFVSFDRGTGDARLFPVDEFQRALKDVLRRDRMDALDYADHRGYLPLRATIARLLTADGLSVRPESVLITSGSQQALWLIFRLLIGPGDTALVESPTYGGALDILRALQARVVGIPLDNQGMKIELVEQSLQLHHPKVIYTIPNFQNPTGVCLSGSRRRQLVALAARYNVPIVEDDYVGDLRYDGRGIPAIKSLDPGGAVIYVSTFSKMLMPGLRVGFLVAEGPIYDRLVQSKEVYELSTSNLIQRVLENYVTIGRYQSHLRRSCQQYRKRRDALLQALERHMRGVGTLELPSGGLFAWLQLDHEDSCSRLMPLAARLGVAFTPGNFFFPDGVRGANCMRLNFAAVTPDEIDEGVGRLAKTIHRMGVT